MLPGSNGESVNQRLGWLEVRYRANWKQNKQHISLLLLNIDDIFAEKSVYISWVFENNVFLQR